MPTYTVMLQSVRGKYIHWSPIWWLVAPTHDDGLDLMRAVIPASQIRMCSLSYTKIVRWPGHKSRARLVPSRRSASGSVDPAQRTPLP